MASPPITNYCIVQATDPTDLETQVKALIDTGWEPIGGVTTTTCFYWGSRCCFFQAMIFPQGVPA